MPTGRKSSRAILVHSGQLVSRGGIDRGSRAVADRDHGTKDHDTKGYDTKGLGTPIAIPRLDVSPIFVHSSFRTSSTWLWSKLRTAPHTTAYYEIFNEGLASLSLRSVSGLNYSAWDSRHPSGAPYFLEFLPLLQQETGGIPGFSSEMALDSFIPAGGLDGELPDAERTYVARLIANAHANRTIPVLCCTRSLGRTRALRKAFGGRTIFCHRNLFHQWASYAGQAMEGNPYFLATIDLTLKACRHDPFLAAVDLWTADRTISPTDEKLFQAFLMLHLYLSAHAYEDSDLLVDVTALATHPALRRKVEAELTKMVSAPVDLSDVRLSFEASPLAVRSPRDVADTITQFTKMISATCRTPQAGAFVEAIKDAALSEWERHEFFVHKIRKVQGANLVRAERCATDATERANAASAERDALVAQISAASAEAAELRDARDLLQHGQSRHGAELEALVATHTDAQAMLMAEVAALRQRAECGELEREAQAHRATAAEADRDRISEDLHAATETVADLSARVSAMAQNHAAQVSRLAEVEAERDLHAQREIETQAERVAQSERAAAAEADRDRVADALQATMAATADLSTALGAMTQERDAQAQRLAEMEVAWDLHAQRAAAAEAERDGQVARATAAEADRDRLSEELKSTSAVITELNAALMAMTQERELLAQRLALPARPRLLAASMSRLRQFLG